MEQVTRITKVYKDVDNRQIKGNCISFSSKEIKLTGPSWQSILTFICTAFLWCLLQFSFKFKPSCPLPTGC